MIGIKSKTTDNKCIPSACDSFSFINAMFTKQEKTYAATKDTELIIDSFNF